MEPLDDLIYEPDSDTSESSHRGQEVTPTRRIALSF
jgi:hypothetical protein